MTKSKKLLEFQFSAKTENLCHVREQLRDIMTKELAACDKAEETLNCIVLAVCEACTNIIRHAYGDQEPGDIILEIEKQGNSMIFRLTDFAHRKSSDEEMKSRNLDDIRPGGLGCHIINEIMDEVRLIECVETCGNILQMQKIIKE